MIILPAIDILDGKAVRLYKGRYDKVTVYGEPSDVAKKMQDLGAVMLHIVDLEGARSGSACAYKKIESIIKETGMKIEVGGGIRNLETIKSYLDLGVENVILGTSAIKDERLLKECVDKYGERIVAGADILDGKIKISGWLEDSAEDYKSFFRRMGDIGIKRIICTDISKDGTMSGTNLTLYRELANIKNMKITASGGVSSIEDVKTLKSYGIDSAIVGKAYYTGAVDLKEAIEVAR